MSHTDPIHAWGGGRAFVLSEKPVCSRLWDPGVTVILISWSQVSAALGCRGRAATCSHGLLTLPLAPASSLRSSVCRMSSAAPIGKHRTPTAAHGPAKAHGRRRLPGPFRPPCSVKSGQLLGQGRGAVCEGEGGKQPPHLGRHHPRVCPPPAPRSLCSPLLSEACPTAGASDSSPGLLFLFPPLTAAVTRSVLTRSTLRGGHVDPVPSFPCEEPGAQRA